MKALKGNTNRRQAPPLHLRRSPSLSSPTNNSVRLTIQPLSPNLVPCAVFRHPTPPSQLSPSANQTAHRCRRKRSPPPQSACTPPRLVCHDGHLTNASTTELPPLRQARGHCAYLRLGDKLVAATVREFRTPFPRRSLLGCTIVRRGTQSEGLGGKPSAPPRLGTFDVLRAAVPCRVLHSRALVM